MSKTFIVRTERLIIYPLSDNEMESLINAELNKGLKNAYIVMLNGCKQNPENRIWYAVWNMQLNNETGRSVGDLCFKGLTPNGVVELGYGIKTEYEGQGYMTEAVMAMARWASEQNGVKNVEAEIEPDNIASQRVLEKAGFQPNGVIGVEGPRFVYREV